MSTNNGISEKFFNFVSQMAHWAVMAFLTLTVSLFFGLNGLLIAIGIGVIYAAWHEFWYDPRYEDAATRGSDVEDFLFLLLGILIGTVTYIAYLQFSN